MAFSIFNLSINHILTYCSRSKQSMTFSEPIKFHTVIGQTTPCNITRKQAKIHWLTTIFYGHIHHDPHPKRRIHGFMLVIDLAKLIWVERKRKLGPILSDLRYWVTGSYNHDPTIWVAILKTTASYKRHEKPVQRCCHSVQIVILTK